MNRWIARVVIVGVLAPLIGCSPAGEYGSWVPPSAVPGAIVAVPQPQR
jgi:hypothetical protein